jgi:hypothetical protein
MGSNAYYIAQGAVIVALVMVSMSAAGCEVIGDIFQAGMVIGILGLVLIIAAIGFVIRKIRR